MKYCTAKKISTQQCYNNEYEVVSLHGAFDLALKEASENNVVVAVSNSVKRGDSIDESGKIWVSE